MSQAYYPYQPPPPSALPTSFNSVDSSYYTMLPHAHGYYAAPLPPPTALPQQQPGASVVVTQEVSKLWVGNLPSDTQEDALRTFFSKHGTVESIRVDGRCAFIKYTEHDDAENAIRLTNGSLFAGNKIKTNWASIKTTISSKHTQPPLLPLSPPPSAPLSPTQTSTVITSINSSSIEHIDPNTDINSTIYRREGASEPYHSTPGANL
ncbi:hypothetical protein SAMD00019534_044880 [Acytostelium subglobosum LB1]|uniref:hypothetical protein n=1 Tax=Acytostelium subglobosum LB1 TaxID=1410327 RepID=UPI000644AD94|nr:hypothetical protein SAMD00019534_044880 [Acytostelium subglobosum LB1]GAM21313.1 hypothetical protein SAMD00019534_044880 [Acytostelium subglobosum LB1]|eukprot:XP_012755432.1 hypothetical protein SAMD00019534_044880 [Acytostelium subglobosum LB1]